MGKGVFRIDWTMPLDRHGKGEKFRMYKTTPRPVTAAFQLLTRPNQMPPGEKNKTNKQKQKAVSNKRTNQKLCLGFTDLGLISPSMCTLRGLLDTLRRSILPEALTSTTAVPLTERVRGRPMAVGTVRLLSRN